MDCTCNQSCMKAIGNRKENTWYLSAWCFFLSDPPVSGSCDSGHWQIWVSSPYVSLIIAHTIPHAPAVIITVKGFREIQVPSLVCQDHSSLVVSPYPKRSGLELCRTSVTSFPFGRLILCTDGLLQEKRCWVRAEKRGLRYQKIPKNTDRSRFPDRRRSGPAEEWAHPKALTEGKDNGCFYW